jgi:ATP-dependent DNA helicase DinG
MLYISERVPFPENKDKRYISAIADEVTQLVKASHGHAAVLFTSYNVMGQVYSLVKNRALPFPLFRLDRGGTSAIEKFKQSGNGVLFASGALWEGIDIPGDALSLLIIVKLPFPVPDPIGEYELSLCGDMETYKRRAIIPDTLVKLMQGFGRLIRSEKDTGVCVILDVRAGKRGAYRRYVLGALPECGMGRSVGDIVRFIRQKKSPEYFKEGRHELSGS